MSNKRKTILRVRTKPRAKAQCPRHFDSREGFVDFADTASDAIVLVDKDGKIGYANARAADLFGFNAEQLLDNPIEFLFPDASFKEQLNAFAGSDKKAREKGEKAVSNLVARHKSGRGVLVRIDLRPVCIADDRYAAGFVRDVSDSSVARRTLTEEALRKSEKQASVAIEAAKALTFNYDIATGNIEWGGAIEKIIGYTPEEFAQVDIDGWAEMIHPDDKDRVLSILQEAVQKEDRATAEYRFRTKKGGYVILSSISLTENEDGKAVRLAGVLQDITERKRTEDALREKNIALRELLGQLEDEKRLMRRQITVNVEQLILPFLTKVRDLSNQRQKRLIDQLERRLKEIASPFLNTLTSSVSRGRVSIFV